MTESSEDGNYLVRVRAQVMSRDDSSGGWVPLGGGGLSNVSVRKRPRPCPSAPGQPQGTPDPNSKPKHDYLIFGKRISDNSIVLSCTIKKDFEYNKVMPTFHHWKTGDKKFGLTFQAAADARAFDKGVRTAVEDLLDDVGDDDVFMTLNLPQEPKDSRSSSDSSGKGTEPPFHKITYIGHDKPTSDPRQPTYDINKGENYQYVQLTAVHDYIYPAEDQQKPSLHRQDSQCSLKKCNIEMLPPKHHHHLHQLQQQQQQQQQQSVIAALPPLKSSKVGQQQQLQLKKSPKMQVRCKHCHEWYSAEHNPKGSCVYAPDVVKSTIDTISCIGCAQCICYHCAADAEGDFAQHPCDCTNDENCSKRWFCLTFLSLIVPCLWLYPPLKVCHWCGIQCGVCGGRHDDNM